MTLTRRDLLRSVLYPPTVLSHPPADSVPDEPLFKPLIRPPQIDPRYWALSIGGAVAHPLVVPYGELLAMPAVDVPCTMLCASNPPGGERIGHAVWRGVPVSALIGEVERDPVTSYVRLEGYNGFKTSVDVSALDDALLAYAANGEPLTLEQGYPARLIIPGYYDHASVRWIQRIEFRNASDGGTRAGNGDDLPGVIERTTVGITSPRPGESVGANVRLTGYAFGGGDPISQIEVSIDDGAWTPVAFERSPQFQWTRWQAEWTAPGPGAYRMAARARTERAATWSATHSIVVQVRERISEAG